MGFPKNTSRQGIKTAPKYKSQSAACPKPTNGLKIYLTIIKDASTSTTLPPIALTAYSFLKKL
jgi:hypothetical protein